MDEQTRQRIKEHLLLENVPDRVLRAMEKGRAEATVTISRAAELFGLTENRLRDWEEYGLLSPLRPTGPKGRRLYTPGELDKLAIIRELLEAGYAPSNIPSDVDAIWQTVYVPGEDPPNTDAIPWLHYRMAQVDGLSVNQRIYQARGDLFWRFYVSHVLRFSLLLICEDLPHTAPCLVLPLDTRVPPSAIVRVEDLERLGECLVGLLSQSRSSHTLLTAAPTFDYASDYRLQPLAAMMEESIAEPWPNHTFLLLDRRARQVTLSAAVMECVGRLLRPLYEDVERSRTCFGVGMRDVLNPSTDLDSVANNEDLILNGMAEMVIRLGGQMTHGEPRWHFCCLFLPNYPASVLSLQQRGLVVRARSSLSPYKIGVTTVSPHDAPVDPCIRALQSGHIVYLHSLTEDTSSTNLRHSSQPTRSAIAVPIAGDDGMAFAVIYVAAATTHAFSEGDERVLRLVGDMVGDLLESYHTLLRPISRLRDLISNPGVVDPLFRDFLSENEFAVDVEKLLAKAHQQGGESVVSLIAVDIDNQSSLAHKYGDFMARELSRTIGLRVKGRLQALKEDAACQFYRMNADRYYLVLDGMSLEQARAKADLLRRMLAGTYHVDTQRVLHGPPTLPENMMTLHNITVRFGVSSYFYSKLQEIIQRFSGDNALVEARLLLVRFLDEVLDIGKREGGNVVVSWDPEIRGFVRIPASSS